VKRAEINVPMACGMDWEAMSSKAAAAGGNDDPARFCGECQKHVHDLSAMTKSEAQTLLASEATDGLCVRYLYDDRGEVVFNSKVGVAPNALSRFAKAKRYVTAAVTLALPMSLNACMGAYRPPPPRVMPAASADPTPTPTTPAATPATPAPTAAPSSTPIAK